MVDETTPLNTPAILQWRRDIETAVLGEPKVDGIILRSAFVYGLSGSYSADFFDFPNDSLVIKGSIYVHSLKSFSSMLTQYVSSVKETLQGDGLGYTWPT